MSSTWIVRRSHHSSAADELAMTGTVSPIAEYLRSGPCRATRRSVLPLQAEDGRVQRPAHPRGVLARSSSNDRLEVGRRAGDHPQDLARRRLLLERLGQRSPEAFDLAPSDPRRPAWDWPRARGVPHAPQNFACGRFSCWHRGQGIWSGSPVRIVSGQPGTASRHPGRRRSSASRPFHGARRPDPTATRPRAPDGRFWGVVRPGLHPAPDFALAGRRGLPP